MHVCGVGGVEGEEERNLSIVIAELGAQLMTLTEITTGAETESPMLNQMCSLIFYF